MLDFRSDTVTRPTDAMRAAMAAAEVGDDVYGDDPTVVRLQQCCADLLGKEAGLFVPSGSMGNLVAVAAQCSTGAELLCDQDAHLLNFECGGLSMFGVVVRSLPAHDGVVSAAALADAVRPGDDHSPRTALLSMEITHTSLGGHVPAPTNVRASALVAREHGVAVHIDGARLFNAVVHSGVDVATWAACADTVTFCFSKGLGAPVGAMVVGTAEVIERARIWRKRLGGAMRQVGVLAAAAHVALTEGPGQLARDHERAQELASALVARFPGVVDPAAVHSNIVHLDCGPLGVSPAELTARLAARGLLTKTYGRRALRLVTHRDLEPGDVEAAVELITETVAGGAA